MTQIRNTLPRGEEKTYPLHGRVIIHLDQPTYDRARKWLLDHHQMVGPRYRWGALARAALKRKYGIDEPMPEALDRPGGRPKRESLAQVTIQIGPKTWARVKKAGGYRTIRFALRELMDDPAGADLMGPPPEPKPLICDTFCCAFSRADAARLDALRAKYRLTRGDIMRKLVLEALNHQ